MTKLMDELLSSAESGRLKALDISDSLYEDKPNQKMKQNFLDGLCALIRKSRLLTNLNISKILIRSETLQNYLFFAF